MPKLRTLSVPLCNRSAMRWRQ